MASTTHRIAPARIGLRAYDIALGFRNVDERNAAITEYKRIHIAGMAVTLAGAIKGHEIVRSVPALQRVSAEVLKINPWAFQGVLRELAEVDLIREVQYRGGEISYFEENVPLVYDDVHERLGLHWTESAPTELEAQLVCGVEALAQSPLPDGVFRDELGLDDTAESMLRAVATPAELVRHYTLSDGTELVVSPLHAFERPEGLVPLFEDHPVELVRDTFGRIRSQPGYPVALGGGDPIGTEMVRLGLVPAPTVIGADGTQRAFLIVPYGIDAAYLTSKKQILGRALAIIACIRCGEVSGGITPIRFPDAVLRSLADPDRNYTLSPHSSTQRQYAPLIALEVIDTVPDPSGKLLSARLIPTDDNLEAVQLARTLLQRRGEGQLERAREKEAAELLFTGREYMAPLQTIAIAQTNAPRADTAKLRDMWASVRGW